MSLVPVEDVELDEFVTAHEEPHEAVEYFETAEPNDSNDSEPEGFDDCDCLDEQIRLDRIAYLSVYDNKGQIRDRGYFVPALSVNAKILKAERDLHGRVHPINRYVYTIHLNHGPYTWTIHRRYGDFFQLNQHLKLFRAGAKLKSSFKRSSRRDGAHDVPDLGHANAILHYTDAGDIVDGLQSQIPPLRIRVSEATEDGTPDPISENGIHEDPSPVEAPKKAHSKLPDFPSLPDSFVNEANLDERIRRMQAYLSAVLHIRPYRNHHETAQFLGVSRLSFVHNLGYKYGEGYIKQRPGGEHSLNRAKNCCLMYCCKWMKRWIVIKDSFVALLHHDEESIEDVVLYDADFRISTNTARDITRVPGSSELRPESERYLTLSNLQRDLVIKCSNAYAADEWEREIREISRAKGQIWLRYNRFGSSFPEREKSYANWFVDGCSFMEHAANMMEIAREEIFITDWWLNPHVYLKRPAKNDHWRLDQVLKRKAESGVRIFLMVYKEVPFTLALSSWYTEMYLTGLHSNIQVMRHPHHDLGGTFYWAHHEKVLVIDQRIAFIGGIDLCYGRWDDHDHRLTDLGDIDRSDLDSIDESDQRAALDEMKRCYEKHDSLIHQSPPQSPPETEPFINPFQDRAKKIVKFDSKHALTVPDNVHHEQEQQLNVADIFKTRFRRMEALEKHRREKSGMRTQKPAATGGLDGRKYWIGKDYVNFIHKDIPEPEKPFDDFVDRMAVWRLPWHDISSVVYGSAARDAARHFIQRWNAARHQGNITNYPLLVPKSYENVAVPDIFRRMSYPCNVQVLRSSAQWSADINATETSIHQAYIHMISNAEHYIYIENQFFVSQMGTAAVENQIARAIFNRIVKAHKARQSFRVYVLMPLLPAFEKESGSLQVVLHWTYASISRGPYNLLEKLRDEIGDTSQYITFCSLRTHSKLVDKLVTELVYIHSKLIIVDDKYCLIGSANINDRSQMGERDSEVALYVDDRKFFPSKMNGQPYESGVFAGSLRRHLFKEHLGLLNPSTKPDMDMDDPACKEFYQWWNELAKTNTHIYEQVFNCAPTDNVRTKEQLFQNEAKIPLAEKDPDKACNLLNDIKGFLVQFPTRFLEDTNLEPSLFTLEGALMPSYVFT